MIITGGEYKGRKITAPDESITRPTLSKVRMGVFNTLYSLIGSFEDKSFLDLFGGSGIIGLEAISRGFSHVVVCEKNKTAANIIKRNYSNLKIVPNLKICDSLKFLKNTEEKFDVIYIDPPYKSGIYEAVFKLIKNAEIIIAEHDEPFCSNDFELIKEKNYGGKRVSFFKNNSVKNFEK